MSVRIGFGLGNLRPLDADQLGTLAAAIEAHGFDSLWLSERITGPAPDPIVGLTFVAARTERIKLGTSVQVLPGRNPAVLAKQWASLDVLSGGRALPAFGLGVANPAEQQAFGVAREERAAWFEEALPLLRRLWEEDDVVHHGERFHYDGISVHPKPGRRMDVWLGGRAPSELRRTGRLADGWLASFTTPAECARSRAVIEDAAAKADREIDPGHFGVMVFYAHEPLPDHVIELLKSRNRGADPRDLVAIGWPAVRERCAQYVSVGFTKLVLVPFAEPRDWNDELAAAADVTQTPVFVMPDDEVRHFT